MTEVKTRKILFLDKAHPVLEQNLSALGFECVTDVTSSKAEVAGFIREFFGIVMRSRFAIDRDFLQNAGSLQFIAREGVGLEHIDEAYAVSRGIRVLNSPEGSRDTVGEHAIGLLLCLLNKLHRADWQVRNGQWVREGNRAVELKGKTVGILGYGNMGSAFARRLQGFDVETLAYDKYKTDYGDRFAKAVSLDQLFESSDILSIHIPFLAGNYHFINEAFLRKFRKNIFVINTARGLVLNTDDLVSNLKSGKVRGAALDVLEYEETSFDRFSLEQLPEAFDYLCHAENVVLSPHIAGWSFESKEKHGLVLAEKIKSLFG